MELAKLCINRPVATTLLALGIVLAGSFAYLKLPVAPLPEIDFPTITVFAGMPGANPDVMAASVATPLERHLGVIADVNEMTSQNSVGQTRITLQFGLGRDLDGAARDVQAAINSARADLPTDLRQNPSYRKFNPTAAPIAVLAMTSDTLTRGQIYDAASTVVQQALSQIDGIGQVAISGSSLPAVRVELNPSALVKYRIGFEDVRAAVTSANAHGPKGAIEDGEHRYQIYANDQANHAADYRPLVIGYRKGAPVRLSDVAEVRDSVENLRNLGLSDGKPAVLVVLYKQPAANVIETVARVKAVLPQLQASIPGAIDIHVTMDRTVTIKASLHEVQRTLVIAVGLVVLAAFLFLRSSRATLVPSVAVPVSLIGTFGVMYLLGYTLDNLSLMAMTVATGLVVDDSVVVLENVTRHIEAGMPRMQAALQGTREVSFTVLAMSTSLIATFVPILLMGGIVGRLFHEFAITLSAAIIISLVVSLTVTPTMCAFLLGDQNERANGHLYRVGERLFDVVLRFYERTLREALRWSTIVMCTLFFTLGAGVYLFLTIPKGFLPQQDNGLIMGGLFADQSTSFQLMQQKTIQFLDILRRDPAVESVSGSTGGGQINNCFIFASLKPLSERQISAEQAIDRWREQLSKVSVAGYWLQTWPEISIGGHWSQFQYTLRGDDIGQVSYWAGKVEAALRKLPALTDVSLDQQEHALETDLVIDRRIAARLGLTVSQIDNTLYNAFGQRPVTTIYAAHNQYHVIMEVAPEFWQTPEILSQTYVSTSGGPVSGTRATQPPDGTVSAQTPGHDGSATARAAQPIGDPARNLMNNSLANHGRRSASTGAAVSTSPETMVPLSAFARFGIRNAPISISHQDLAVAATISFNLAPGISLGGATAAIEDAVRQLAMPVSIRGGFEGTTKVFRQSLASQPYLIAAALIAVYIVLGVLYESYIHPITILSTLPSAGAGAVLALVATNTEFSIVALIGVILLIGIVKKSAIIMIDFALDIERRLGLSPREAIYRACLTRFRPIMMTTIAAMLGAVPLAIDSGEGAELRRPLGISIIGGLLVSQILTLYTTPVLYLYFDRLRSALSARPRATRP